MEKPDHVKGEDPTEYSTSNNDLVKDAGQVHIDEAQGWGVGIIKDFKRTVGTHWKEEMTNFNQKTVAVTLLMFISVIAPTLTFGAVYGKETDNRIGTVETILATAWVGILYSLIGGMPLVSEKTERQSQYWLKLSGGLTQYSNVSPNQCIIGSTGPVIAFRRAVTSIAKNIDVPFLTFHAWISVWLLFYCFLAAFLTLLELCVSLPASPTKSCPC